MKSKKHHVQHPHTAGPAGDTDYQLTQQLKFTEPALDLVIDFVPQTRLPVLPDSTTLDKGNFASYDGNVFHPDRPIQTLDNSVLAQLAIEAKAKMLAWIGGATSEVERAGQGYIARYEAADIYYSAETGAHEVHGDIRAKYNAFGAANGVLGLPTTDETKPPDNIGRFNHFQGGSIYWKPNTGPMVVRGAIRDMWAMQGWETSAFAYPIADYLTKTGNPLEYWGGFENGAIYSKDNTPEEALVVELAPRDLTNLVRKTFDKELKTADSDLGIQGGVNVLNISDWGYGFWESIPRTVTYEINGFYSTGIPVAADPTFRLELRFQFELLWKKGALTQPMAANCSPLRSTLLDLQAQLKKIDKFIKDPPKPVLNPEWTKLNKRVLDTNQLLMACENSNTTASLTLSEVDKTLIIYLRNWRISTSGPFNKELFDQLVKKLPDKFPFAVKTIPAKALLMDVLVTPQGGLKFLLAPGLFGKIRRDAFETELNNFIES
jgi:LGFP repeat